MRSESLAIKTRSALIKLVGEASMFSAHVLKTSVSSLKARKTLKRCLALDQNLSWPDVSLTGPFGKNTGLTKNSRNAFGLGLKTLRIRLVSELRVSTASQSFLCSLTMSSCSFTISLLNLAIFQTWVQSLPFLQT